MSVAVVLVIDCTGSMEEIHEYLGKKLSDIAKMFSEEGMPVHFAAVGFRDFPDEGKENTGLNCKISTCSTRRMKTSQTGCFTSTLLAAAQTLVNRASPLSSKA